MGDGAHRHPFGPDVPAEPVEATPLPALSIEIEREVVGGIRPSPRRRKSPSRSMAPLIVLLRSRVGEVFATPMAISSRFLQYSQIRSFGGPPIRLPSPTPQND